MAILTVTPTINATTGAVTYTASNPSNGDIITGVVLRDFMTNGPDKKANGTYETDVAKLVFPELSICTLSTPAVKNLNLSSL